MYSIYDGTHLMAHRSRVDPFGCSKTRVALVALVGGVENVKPRAAARKTRMELNVEVRSWFVFVASSI